MTRSAATRRSSFLRLPGPRPPLPPPPGGGVRGGRFAPPPVRGTTAPVAEPATALLVRVGVAALAAPSMAPPAAAPASPAAGILPLLRCGRGSFVVDSGSGGLAGTGGTTAGPD